MAETKKTATVKSAAKAEAAQTAAGTVAEVKAPDKKEVKVKTTANKIAAKPTVKKAPVKKEAKAETKAVKVPAKKASAKQVINLQFGGKSYGMEDLVKIAEDVWTYDLHKGEEKYKSLELYVKPEECVAYYVFNSDIAGSFFI